MKRKLSPRALASLGDWGGLFSHQPQLPSTQSQASFWGSPWLGQYPLAGFTLQSKQTTRRGFVGARGSRAGLGRGWRPRERPQDQWWLTTSLAGQSHPRSRAGLRRKPASDRWCQALGAAQLIGSRLSTQPPNSESINGQ